MMNRRAFMSVTSGAAIAWPLAVRAQQPAIKVPKIGWLQPTRGQPLPLSGDVEDGSPAFSGRNLVRKRKTLSCKLSILFRSTRHDRRSFVLWGDERR